MDANERTPAGSADDALYDLYLDAALEGHAEAPEDFLARHPEAGAALGGRLAALRRMLTGTGAPHGAPAAGAIADAVPFERLGGFRLLRRLGEGGMGSVYLAEEESLARTVALKVVRADLQGSPNAAERFRREALAVARLRHESVVAVHAIGEDGGVRWIAMEYVEGKGLDEILATAARAGTRVPAADAVRWAARIARALQAAHAAGIVHRDVKPSNVRITEDGRPMLLDFGVARELGAEGLTGTAPFIGSPAYAAPEQITGETAAADARTDVYSLGVVLYECLAGRAPWAGRTVERTFHAILAEEPPRLRRLQPSISRDLEVVVAKAMEKAPARRYNTAAQFADDLDALLEFRPVRARPASAAGRLAKWARRRPGPAAAGATVAAALVALAAILVAQERSSARLRRQDAASTVVAARERIEDYRERRARFSGLEREFDATRVLERSRFLEPAEARLLEEQEDAIAAYRRDREAVFHEVLDLVRRAESLDPAVTGAADVRAELYLEKWREASDANDPAATAYYREKLVASDPEGRVAAEVSQSGSLDVTSEPSGAEVYAFRYVEQSGVAAGGEKRLVPVPIRGEAPFPPGTWTFDVTFGAAGVRRGDLVLAFDGVAVRDMLPSAARELAARGGAAARIFRGGDVVEATLPPGLRGRVTAAPVPVSAQTLIGCTPLRGLQLEPGSYLLVLRRDGFEDVRRPVVVLRAASAGVAVELFREGATPPGFVRVESGVFGVYWIMEREVSASEYLEFLNDPRTRREIDASQVPLRFPRGLEPLACGSPWPRGDDGLFRLAPDWGADWPVFGVSIEDARAYAVWRTARARAEGSDVVYGLPTHDEWVVAANGAGDRQFPYGNRFRAKWAKSCFSQRRAFPEAVLSYPVDESPSGAFDLSGSVTEWCESWYDEGRRLLRLGGGSWAQGEPDTMKIWAPSGAAADFTSGETGFRLVARRAARAR